MIAFVARVRLTRAQSKALTRERLLGAARTVFASRGFHRASVDEIAAEAGYSTGAVYASFGGKEDLFVILVEREIGARARKMAAAADQWDSRTEQAMDEAREWSVMVEPEPEMLLLLIEFWAYGARDAEMRARVAAWLAHLREPLARLIAGRVHEVELGLPAEHLAVAIDALADGIGRQRLIDPRTVPDDLLGNAIMLLLAGARRIGSQPRA
jgi:AcrR family transcriptional regulator